MLSWLSFKYIMIRRVKILGLLSKYMHGIVEDPKCDRVYVSIFYIVPNICIELFIYALSCLFSTSLIIK